jgi:hypothetical protein
MAKNHVWIIEAKNEGGDWQPMLNFFNITEHHVIPGVHHKRSLARKVKNIVRDSTQQFRVQKYEATK